jgi:arylsulfatase A-like enzyme
LGRRKGKQFDRYLSEVAVVDTQLRRVLDMLADTGLDQRTVLIITADHGEAFGEHGNKTHGTTLYEEEIRVPLMIRTPSRFAARIDQLISLLDLGPTVLDLFNQATPGHYMGQSLKPFLVGETPKLTRPVASEGRLKQAMIFPDGIKVIYDTRKRTSEVYDLTRDPGEQDDLSDDEAIASEPVARLRAFFEAHTLKRDGYEPPYVR